MLSSKQLGVIFVVFGLLVTALTFAAKAKEDFYIDMLIEEHDGVCILENGYCLHNDRNWTGYVVAWVLGACAVIFGAYLFFFEKSYELFQKDRDRFAKDLAAAKQKDEFAAFVSGFTKEEQSILKAVHEQDGIKQSTLRYRVGMSKASVSLLVNSLEQRDILKRKPVGKTKEIYLRKKF